MSERADLFGVAAALMNAGRTAEAILAHERIVMRWPDFADAWYNLGLLQRRAGDARAALGAYGEALKHGAPRPEEIHLNRGVIYADHLFDTDAAEAEYSAALALNPNYVPALLNLGNLHEDRGKRGEAVALYERALGIDPECADALARIANAEKIESADAPVVTRLRRAITRAGPADRATLGFALGKALDEAGAYDDAFAAYVAANAASRASAPVGAALYDRAAHEALIDATIAAFPARRADAAVSQAEPPIFICGMFRSGSTLTEQVLAAHSRVTSGGELNFIPRLVQSSLPGFPQSMARAGAADLQRLAGFYEEAVRATFPNAVRVTDKRPDNFLYVGLIKSLFPGARIVHTTRDILDNCLSVYFLHLDHRMGYALDLADIAHYAAQCLRLMTHWSSLYPGDILSFDYDAFVQSPRPAVERLLAFCGLDWEDGTLAFHRVRNAVKTASVWQVREPLYQRSSGRWRNYEKHLAPLRAELARLGLA